MGIDCATQWQKPISGIRSFGYTGGTMTATEADRAAPQPSLRERKKLRTREALIGTALDLFTERGFEGATLDDLCNAVEVSKRTFFRTFAGKEDVVMAPTQDMWAAFTEELETRPITGGGTLLAFLQDSLLAAVDRMTDEAWPRRVRLSRRLAAKNPSMDAHGLQFCDHTLRTSLATLQRRLTIEDPNDPRPRLALDLLAAANHWAMERWVELPGAPDRDTFTAQLRTAFAAIPQSVTITATPRATA
jgi:AcrR family transcriptional regulator